MIGKGGFGAIYQAQSTVDRSVVAVKTLHKHLLEDKDVVERFQREARSLATLHHPNIVQLVDFDWDDQVGHFMVLEWLPGRSLKAHLKQKKRLSLLETFDIFEQFLSGLGDAHNQGIVHRDLKPGNLFVVPDGERLRIKILDFGLALLSFELMRRTRQGAVMGSSNYMSPEQSMGKVDEIDVRTDIYSVGCLLSRCLTGRTPFRGNAYEIAMLHYNKEPIPRLMDLYPKGPFSEELEYVFARCIARDRADRFGSTWELYDALRNALLPLIEANPADTGHGKDVMQTFITGAPQGYVHQPSARPTDRPRFDYVSPQYEGSWQPEAEQSDSLEFDLDSALHGLDGTPTQGGSENSVGNQVMSLSMHDERDNSQNAFAETYVFSEKVSAQDTGEPYYPGLLDMGGSREKVSAPATGFEATAMAPPGVAMDRTMLAPSSHSRSPGPAAEPSQLEIQESAEQAVSLLRESSGLPGSHSSGLRSPSADVGRRSPSRNFYDEDDSSSHDSSEGSGSSSISLIKRGPLRKKEAPGPSPSRPPVASSGGRRPIKMRGALVAPKASIHPAILWTGVVLAVGLLGGLAYWFLL